MSIVRIFLCLVCAVVILAPIVSTEEQDARQSDAKGSYLVEILRMYFPHRYKRLINPLHYRFYGSEKRMNTAGKHEMKEVKLFEKKEKYLLPRKKKEKIKRPTNHNLSKHLVLLGKKHEKKDLDKLHDSSLGNLKMVPSNDRELRAVTKDSLVNLLQGVQKDKNDTSKSSNQSLVVQLNNNTKPTTATPTTSKQKDEPQVPEKLVDYKAAESGNITAVLSKGLRKIVSQLRKVLKKDSKYLKTKKKVKTPKHKTKKHKHINFQKLFNDMLKSKEEALSNNNGINSFDSNIAELKGANEFNDMNQINPSEITGISVVPGEQTSNEMNGMDVIKIENPNALTNKNRMSSEVVAFNGSPPRLNEQATRINGGNARINDITETNGIIAMERVPSMERVSEIEGVPSMNRVPSMERAPSMERVPAIERVPSMNRVPAIERVPAMEEVPAMDRVPAIDRVSAMSNRIEQVTRPDEMARIQGVAEMSRGMVGENAVSETAGIPEAGMNVMSQVMPKQNPLNRQMVANLQTVPMFKSSMNNISPYTAGMQQAPVLQRVVYPQSQLVSINNLGLNQQQFLPERIPPVGFRHLVYGYGVGAAPMFSQFAHQAAPSMRHYDGGLYEADYDEADRDDDDDDDDDVQGGSYRRNKIKNHPPKLDKKATPQKTKHKAKHQSHN